MPNFDTRNLINPTVLKDIDYCNEWLMGVIVENQKTVGVKDDLIFEDDTLALGVLLMWQRLVSQQ